MTVMVFLALCFILAQTSSGVDSAGLLQQPEPQHILDGSNTTFSCRICDSYVIWKVMFSNGTTRNLHHMQRPDVHIMTRPPEGSERTSILTINTYDALSWNNTLLQCVVHYGTQDILSQYVALVIYTSLRPPSPSSMWISAINTTTLSLNWIPAFLWQGYQIDNFSISVNVTNTNNSERVLETSVEFEKPMEPIKHFTFSNINITSFLYPCTEFLFSVSSVSAMYGESDPIVTTGGFGEVPNEAIFVNKVVYFTANGTPLVELEIELPGNVCSYQDINYTIVIEEQSPLGFNQGFIVGPFSHRGSGRVNQRIISGLVMRKNYSLSVIVNTSVGNSKTKTYFDTGTWLEVSDDNIITSSDQLENVVTVSHKNMTHYIIIALGSVALLIIIGFITLFVSFCFAKEKKKNGGHNTNRKIMVHNPIYDKGPVYDTIPITPSETPADSEVNRAPKISGFQKSSSTFTNAYVDEPHNSPLQRNPLDNVHAPSVSFNLKDDVAEVSTATPGPSLESEPIGQVVTDHEKGEESSYALMFPAAGGMVANSKS